MLVFLSSYFTKLPGFLVSKEYIVAFWSFPIFGRPLSTEKVHTTLTKHTFLLQVHEDLFTLRFTVRLIRRTNSPSGPINPQLRRYTDSWHRFQFLHSNTCAYYTNMYCTLSGWCMFQLVTILAELTTQYLKDGDQRKHVEG